MALFLLQIFSFQPVQETGTHILTILFILLITPLGEEILFRGIGIGVLTTAVTLVHKHIMNKPLPAWNRAVFGYSFLLVSSAVFALGHPGDLHRQTFTFIVGLLYGLVYLTSGNNLAVPYMAHVFNNLLIYGTSVLE